MSDLIQKAKLVRKWFSNRSTIGEYYLNDIFYCYILEDVARAAGVKIYGDTCIPEGLYKLSMNQSIRFKKMMPIIYNSENFIVSDNRGNTWEGIRQHIANSAIDVIGCQAMGTEKGENKVIHSKDIFDPYYLLLQESIIKNGPIPFTIINQQVA